MSGIINLFNVEVDLVVAGEILGGIVILWIVASALYKCLKRKRCKHDN